VGEWLPEPIATAEDADAARHAEIADALSLELLVVLETLSPEQRAVFLLREVFDYPFGRIAEVLGKSPAAVRQLAVRARRHVGEREPRFETSREQRDRLAASFFEAFEEGKLEDWRRCSPKTSPCAATAAARCQSGRARYTAASASPARCALGRERPRVSASPPCAGSR
jgi:hypothetical protein